MTTNNESTETIIIEFKDKIVIDWIKKVCEFRKVTPLEYITGLIDMRLPETEEINTTSVVIALHRKYTSEYLRRFGVPYTEQISTKQQLMMIKSIVDVMANQLKNVKRVQEILGKAITWYLFFHDTSNNNGGNYGYGIKYLFSKEKTWLLQTCIENAMKMDDKVFQLIQEKKLTKEEAIRMIRRGDSGDSEKQISVSAERDKALKIFAEIKKWTTDSANQQQFLYDLKTNIKIENLFKTNVPDLDYITNAQAILQQMLNQLKQKKND